MQKGNSLLVWQNVTRLVHRSNLTYAHKGHGHLLSQPVMAISIGENMSPKVCRISFATALLAMLVSPAYAGVDCSGKVENHLIDSSGNVFVTHSAVGTVQICNVNIDWNDISPTLCFAWLALIKDVGSKPVSVTLNYSYNSCAAIPQSNFAPAPNYIQQSRF